MAEKLLKVEIVFLGEEGIKEFLGKINHDTKMFEFYEGEVILSNGFIPLSSIKTLKIVGEKMIDTPYTQSVFTTIKS